MITLSISKQKSELRICVHYKLFARLGRWIGHIPSFGDVREREKMKEKMLYESGYIGFFSSKQ